MNNLWLVLWIFLPAGLANAAPVLAAKLPGLGRLDAPMDFEKTFRGKRIFGAHKTWRGLAAGVVLATATLALQQWLVAHNGWLAGMVASDGALGTTGVHYDELPTLIVGVLFGLGVLLGDAIKSFAKRQVGVAPGRTWFPFDQIDYIIGGAIAVLPFIRLSLGQYALLLVVWLGIHVVSVYIGWLVGVRERPI